MKILLAGDSHGNTKYIRQLIDIAKGEDCFGIFILGDFGYWEHQPDGVKYLDDINEYGVEKNVIIYWLRGNHDKLSLLEKQYSSKDSQGFVFIRDYVRFAPDGHQWIWDGHEFFVLGGAYSVDKEYRLHLEKKKAEKIVEQNTYRPKNSQRSIDTSGLLWFPEEELSDEDVSRILLNSYGPVDIMLTHDKPRASSLGSGFNRKDLVECHPNQDRIQVAINALRPKIVFHGHLHYPYIDHIRISEREFVKVHGLDSDSQSRHSRHHRNSWTILDLSQDIATLTESSQVY